ncbi:jg6600 [Pararge aegeria aegeria]|uniref:Jg6600 protein n=1 Tax=Pararge aegeria aegeria TaxID=348720 RepID=A0A8S4RU83_9NEOP|nr:jg6600 [Pararge aegeria aegeria]
MQFLKKIAIIIVIVETKAVDYLKKRTPARAALMIAAVWLMSALVCIPPLLGWRVTRPPEQFPQCKVRYP